MSDPFSDYAQSLESPASVLFAVTPDDATDLVTPSRARIIACNTIVRQPGIDAARGASQARISGPMTNGLVDDNVSNTIGDFTTNGSVSDNNRTITLANPNAVPVAAPDAAAYMAAFAAPVLVTGQSFDPSVACAVGPLDVASPVGVFNGTYDRATDTFTPRLSFAPPPAAASSGGPFERADELLDV